MEYYDKMLISQHQGKRSYYRELNNYAKSEGLTYTVGNTGTSIAKTYVDVVDNVIIFEAKGLPSTGDLAQWDLLYLD